MERMQQEWARIQRHGGSLGFIMADIDHFKQINDVHGHSAGDRVLCAAAQAIMSQCRESDTPARYGGEEFAILCPDSDAEGSGRLAERCRAMIEKTRVQLDGCEVGVTASFGVTDSAAAKSVDEVIEAADNALYEAKRGGRNRVHVDKKVEPSLSPQSQSLE